MKTDHDDDLDPTYDRRQEELEAHGDYLRDEMIDRQMERDREERLKKPAERPTPITDAIVKGEWIQYEKACRNLERQLAEANDTITHLRMENELIEFYKIQDQLADERALADRLANALDMWRCEGAGSNACYCDAQFAMHGAHPSHTDECRASIEALTAWKEARKQP
jgi:hypothetical protein